MTYTDEFTWFNSEVEQIFGATTQFKWEQEYMTNPCIPILEGFEKVLGRKFKCGDCEDFGKCWNNSIKTIQGSSILPCFKLSNDIKVEIKLKDKEIEATKIDTHPRYTITVRYGPNLFRDWKLIL